MEKEFTIKSIKGDFRVAIKNGIEAVAMKYCVYLSDDSDAMTKNFEKILEHIEYRVDKDEWIKVKEGNNYYPNGIDQNANAIMEIVEYFMKYLAGFFYNSNN